jgi:hypothetical protein
VRHGLVRIPLGTKYSLSRTVCSRSSTKKVFARVHSSREMSRATGVQNSERERGTLDSRLQYMGQVER